MNKICRYVAVVAVAALLHGAASPARADDGASQVVVAAVTAALTAAGTLLVKDYFDSRRENEKIQRDTDDLYADIARFEKTTQQFENENALYLEKTKRANEAAAFYRALIQEDEEFFKPRHVAERAREYERALEVLFVRSPELVEKINAAMGAPGGDWERALTFSAYGAGTPRADFWEIKKRMEAALTGGVVIPAGEKEARYVSGAENLMAVVEYVRSVAGETYLAPTLQRLWDCSPEEVVLVLSTLPAPGRTEEPPAPLEAPVPR